MAVQLNLRLPILKNGDQNFDWVTNILKNLGRNVELVLFEGVKNNAQDLSENVDNVTLIQASEYSNCEKTT